LAATDESDPAPSRTSTFVIVFLCLLAAALIGVVFARLRGDARDA
jgi:hypothetical protein